jgi:hypothetical protein
VNLFLAVGLTAPGLSTFAAELKVVAPNTVNETVAEIAGDLADTPCFGNAVRLMSANSFRHDARLIVRELSLFQHCISDGPPSINDCHGT